MAEEGRGAAQGISLWMTTYSDMVTLLLTFFVMLFAFADIDKAKYEQIAESLRGALKGMPSILRLRKGIYPSWSLFP